MKIAIIGTTANSMIGFRADLIRYLDNNKHEIYAFALDYDDNTRKQVYELGAIPIDYTFSRTGANPFKDLYNTLLLSKQLKKLKPDLVLSYFSKPCIFGSMAAMLAGVKKRYGMLEGLGFLFTEQPNGVHWKIKLLKFIQVTLYRFVFPKLDALILLNKDDQHDLLIKHKIKVKHVHILGGIGVNLEEYPFSIAPTDPVSFIFIARFLAEKGIYEYLSAAKIVKQRYPTTIFYLLGDIDSDNQGSLSKQQVTELINDNIVIAPGYVSNVPDWIKKSSVFVLPSYYREGVPRSTQEAMAIGRAILTTDVPGCRETVIHGSNGYLVQRWDANELAERMCELIENPEKILEMGKVSYQLAQEKFDSDKSVNRLISILNITH